MASREAASKLINFINKSPSPYHAVAEAVASLTTAGFQRLDEASNWDVKPGGKYFLTRNASTLIAFSLGGKYERGNPCQLIGAHTDSPCLRVKQRSKDSSVGYDLVKAECYGGGIWATWFDRDLKLAGKAIVHTEKGLVSKLVHLDHPLLHVPTLAIHLNRSVNESFQFNKENELVPVLGLIEEQLNDEKSLNAKEKQQQHFHRHHNSTLMNLLSEELECTADKIMGFDLCMADYTAAGLGGIKEEFIMAPRQDNLVNAWAGVEALVLHATGDSFSSSPNCAVLCLYDHEEVGSTSAHGAQTELTNLVLGRIAGDKLPQCIATSFLLSADQVHAVHPNYTSKHEGSFRPQLNGGVTIKHNSNQRYATTAMGAALIRQLARQNDLPLQEVMVRNDSSCGSTIGPLISAKTGLRTLDLGCPQLSMHSIREMGGTEDAYYAVQLYTAFYSQFGELDRASSDD